jgi:hypothetical protein
MKKIKDFLIFLFGKGIKKRYIRIIIIILILVFSFILIQNVGCGYKDNRFWFEWQPAAEIKIEK